MHTFASLMYDVYESFGLFQKGLAKQTYVDPLTFQVTSVFSITMMTKS